MVRVEVYRAPTGRVVSFVASGHAKYAPKGSDIVCAAVSVLTQTVVLALPQHVGVTPTVTVDEESGRLECRLPDALNERQEEHAQLLLETMITGLVEIAREYSKFVRLKEVTLR